MDYFLYQNGELHAEQVSLKALAEQIGTPFYCYSTATLTRHVNVFLDAFKNMDVKLCYAVKANGNLEVLRTLHAAGAGADVVSEGEIRLALAAGIPASHIVFSGVGKTREEMAYALGQNIFQFNVESEPELLALQDVAASLGKKAPIALRVNPDVVAGTHAKISTGQKESKFGIAIARAHEVYALAATLPNIAVQGVSVHIGSQLTQLAPFESAFAVVTQFVKDLRAAGHTISVVDLGGGLGIPYTPEDAPPAPTAYAEVVKHFADEIGCQIVLEPGRLIVGNAGILVSRVEYVKEEGGRTYVILDAGMNDLLRPTLYEAYHAIVPVDEPSKTAAKQRCDIVGPVCETGDIFAADREIVKPKAGDLIAIRSAGAYGASMASTYNARRLPAEVQVNGEQWKITRARQSYDDIIKAYS